MKCDKCDKEATVHEVMIRGGKRSERHLCEQHAREEGVAPQNPGAVPYAQIVTKFLTGPGILSTEPVSPSPPPTGRAGAAKANQCPSCGMTFAQFRQVGLLGCPECYAAFESQLGPLLSRAHEGGTHHVGRAASATTPHAESQPAAAAAAARNEQALAARQTRISAIKLRLAEAVDREEYEKAAALRDELAKLSMPAPAAPVSPAPRAIAKRVKRDAPAKPESDSGGPGTEPAP